MGIHPGLKSMKRHRRPLRSGKLRHGALRQPLLQRMRERRLAQALRRQSLRIARSAAEREEMDFLEAVQADNPLDD